MELFTSFEGRIARGQWWIGVIALVVAVLVLQTLLAMVLGAGFFGRLVVFAVSLAFIYPALALATKRLADRGKPPMPRLALFYGPGVLVMLLDTFRIGYRRLGDTPGMPSMQMEGMPSPDAMMPGALPMFVGFLALVAGIWALVELGFLKGDAEANQFGPPPQ